MMGLLDWALEYVRRGWYVLPLYPIVNGKCSCPDRVYKVGPDPSKWKCSPGKHPFSNLPHGVKDASNDPNRIRMWWGPTMWPDAGIGIALGPSDLLDVAPDGVDDLADFIARGLPDTLSFRSGGGEGHQHSLYQLPPGTPHARLCVPGHYDIMSDGYCVAPPTRHASGGQYTWSRYDSHWPTVAPPTWAIELLQDQINARTPAASVSVPGEAVLGQNGEPPLEIDADIWAGLGFADRSSVLWAIAGELAQAGANEATIVEALRERDQTLGLGKYSNRKDQDKRYTETARRQLANVLPRIHLNGSSVTMTVPSTPTFAPDADWPEPMTQDAFYGPLGEFVLRAAEQSEASAEALLAMHLSAVSAAMHPNTAAKAGDAFHPIRLNTILIGETAEGRKGTAGKVAENVIRQADDIFLEHIVEGLSSGEGLLYQIRDEVKKWSAKDQDHVTTDKGVTDKRLLVVETEFGSTLRMLEREGNSLSGMVRRAWDLSSQATLTTLVKNAPTKATGAHVVIAGHVTRDEFLHYVTRTELVNGFANRFLWFAVKRKHLLPFGDEIDPQLVTDFAEEVRKTSAWTRLDHRMNWAHDTRAAWEAAYRDFHLDARSGMFKAITARAEAQVLRVSELFAAFDRTNHIGLPHLKAALAVWHYVEQTCRWLFGNILGDQVADDILVGLRTEGPMTQTQIWAYLGRHANKAALERALQLLLNANLAAVDRTPTGGRPLHIWRAL